jgi:DMSO/TMAO reductase YedYZ molybdopterin-dependent catalytic subunit
MATRDALETRPSALPIPDPRTLAAGLAGAVAAGVGIALAELLAGLVPGAPSLVVAIGSFVIDHQPAGAKDLVVELFGSNDKLALNLLIVVVALAIAGGFGVVARARPLIAEAAFGVFGLAALGAALVEPLVDPVLAVITASVATGASILALRWLVARTVPEATNGRATARARARAGAGGMPDWDRRGFLIRAGGLAVGSIAVAAGGRRMLETRPGGESGTGAIQPLPHPDRTAPPLPANAALDVPGITPIVVPNGDFYRIDTALIVPRVDASTWRLHVDGMVDREVVLSYDDLRAMPQFEQYVTIACVSNKVGDHLVGNALWSGVRLREVLAMAGVQQGATQIVGRSVDDFTVGFPTEWAMDPSREPMIALGMNGTPLPLEHGYPARLIVPGLFGYVSATKWLHEIELTTLDAFDAYWVPLGWAKEGPILTQSRIDVPRAGASLKPGPVTIAGVAWAPDRGISKVEVSIDGGAWQACMLSAAISKATWVQWELAWTPPNGHHTIEVRATDGTGTVQTADVTPPPPDGARGHHTIEVDVG